MKKIQLTALAAAVLVSLAACFSAFTGDETGTLTIGPASMPASIARAAAAAPAGGRAEGLARTVVPAAGGELASMTYKVTLSGPGGTIEREFGPGGGSVSLAVGTSVTAKAYNGDGRLRGITEQPLRVSGGGTHTVSLKACIGLMSAGDIADINTWPNNGSSGTPIGMTMTSEYVLPFDLTAGNTNLFVLQDDITVSAASGGLRFNPPGSYELRSEPGATYTLSLAQSSSAALHSLVEIAANVKLTMRNVILQGQSSQTSLGSDNDSAVVKVNGGEFTMLSGKITGNSPGTTSSEGGGVTVSANGAFIMNGGEIRVNNAVNGGGVYVTGSSSRFEMHGGTIAANNVTGSGGGVFIDSGASFIMSGGIIGVMSGISNFATGTGTGGGGVYVNGGSFTMSGGAVSGNETTMGNGGGVCFNGGSFTMSGGKISGNDTVTGNGGGVYFDSAAPLGFTMNAGAVISGNTANGGGGGGVYFDGGSAFTMSGGTISYNTADGGTSAQGGGLYLNGGTVTITGGVIEYNTVKNGGSSSTGGGISLSGSSVTLKGITVRNNRAEHPSSVYGGGLYINRTGSTPHVYGGGMRVENNTADAASSGNAKGGGIYDPGSSGPTATITGPLYITGNEVIGISGPNTAGGGVNYSSGNPPWTDFTFSGNKVNGSTTHSTADHN